MRSTGSGGTEALMTQGQRLRLSEFGGCCRGLEGTAVTLLPMQLFSLNEHEKFGNIHAHERSRCEVEAGPPVIEGAGSDDSLGHRRRCVELRHVAKHLGLAGCDT